MSKFTFLRAAELANTLATAMKSEVYELRMISDGAGSTQYDVVFSSGFLGECSDLNDEINRCRIRCDLQGTLDRMGAQQGLIQRGQVFCDVSMNSPEYVERGGAIMAKVLAELAFTRHRIDLNIVFED